MHQNTYPVAVHLVVLTIREGALHIALVERGISPHQGRYALPGGFVLPNESLEEAARRELHEETGLAIEALHFEQLATFGSVNRDPRGRVISVAYLVFVPFLGVLKAGSDAADALWINLSEVPPLAFDHDAIAAAGVERARAKLEYATVAPKFCGPTFTIAQLRGVYEAAWGVPIDARNFSRKVLSSPGFLIEVGRQEGKRGRPARLYRAGPAQALFPPILREG